ncbi:endonuclease/exonuclease/phosphatase family protein [Micromonospora sp. NPDC050397]|uniref:endonuclease/exonuclease/phosphatase family protein n=1 Tax=Micromonospora sp. NPDC050397 TaxID=3364279 RepID=UPI00384AF60E
MHLTLLTLNLQHRSMKEGRWPGLASVIRAQQPDLVLLQEADWLTNPDHVRTAEDDLGMTIVGAPSRNLPVGVAWRCDKLTLVEVDTAHSAQLHHGYSAPRFDVPGLTDRLPVPLVVISTHLIPYSAQQAAQEAQTVATRLYRYGGLGVVGGDINHLPLGDEEPDWETIQPYNRAARCHRRRHDAEPWRGNRIVGETLRDAGLVDACAHIADQRKNPSLRRPTGKAGGVRVDQFWATASVAPAIDDYVWVNNPHGDHHGVLTRLDLTRIDRGILRDYT